MKILIISITFATLFRFMITSPPSTLPEYPVKGTLKVEKFKSGVLPGGLRHVSGKMHYLKTGKHINSEINYIKQQNYWGKGVPTNVRFPVHLVKWEEFRRKRDTQKKVMFSN